MPINPKLVHVDRLTDAVEGREKGAWVFQYHGESFLTGPDGTDPEPFAWNDQPHEPVDFEARSQEEIAGLLRINPAKLAFVQRDDPAFPPPIVIFRGGPIWSAEAIEAWAPTRAPDTTRDRSLPRG